FCNELGGIGPDILRIARAPDDVDPCIAMVYPARLLQPPTKCSNADARVGSAFDPHQRADEAHALALLRARRERPCDAAGEERNERAALHSITSSATCRGHHSDLVLRSAHALACARLEGGGRPGPGGSLGRPHASRRIAARHAWGSCAAASRCDAPQHEGKGPPHSITSSAP